jgi:serine/threonine protein phosphatase PrpC
MKTNGWISAWCSKIGSSHIEKGLPCQDFSQVKYIRGANFAIAAVSDGAGSCENSDTGSRFLVVNAIRKISVRLVRNRFYADGNPGLDETLWRELAFGIFTELKAELGAMAEKEHLDFRSLSATLILAISDGSFVACANVGDGRAAFRNRESEWFPMLVPTKGEEANQTLFITSDLWDCGRDSEYF